MKDYKQYNSTVKSVQVACEQASGGYHLSEGDLSVLRLAIEDLTSIYNVHSEEEVLELRNQLKVF